MEDRAELLSLLKMLADVLIYAQEQNNQRKVDEYADLIRTNTSAKKQYAGFRRAFFKDYGLTEYVAAD